MAACRSVASSEYMDKWKCEELGVRSDCQYYQYKQSFWQIEVKTKKYWCFYYCAARNNSWKEIEINKQKCVISSHNFVLKTIVKENQQESKSKWPIEAPSRSLKIIIGVCKPPGPMVYTDNSFDELYRRSGGGAVINCLSVNVTESHKSNPHCLISQSTICIIPTKSMINSALPAPFNRTHQSNYVAPLPCFPKLIPVSQS